MKNALVITLSLASLLSLFSCKEGGVIEPVGEETFVKNEAEKFAFDNGTEFVDMEAFLHWVSNQELSMFHSSGSSSYIEFESRSRVDFEYTLCAKQYSYDDHRLYEYVTVYASNEEILVVDDRIQIENNQGLIAFADLNQSNEVTVYYFDQSEVIFGSGRGQLIYFGKDAYRIQANDIQAAYYYQSLLQLDTHVSFNVGCD